MISNINEWRDYIRHIMSDCKYNQLDRIMEKHEQVEDGEKESYLITVIGELLTDNIAKEGLRQNSY